MAIINFINNFFYKVGFLDLLCAFINEVYPLISTITINPVFIAMLTTSKTIKTTFTLIEFFKLKAKIYFM